MIYYHLTKNVKLMMSRQFPVQLGHLRAAIEVSNHVFLEVIGVIMIHLLPLGVTKEKKIVGLYTMLEVSICRLRE